MDKEEKLEFCLKMIKRVQHENEQLNRDRVEAIRFYNSEPDIVPIVAGRSQVTTSDLMDVIEWVKPTILEIFTAGSECVSLQPAEEKDVLAVDNHNLLINHQLKVKNNWFMVLHDWFDDAFKLKTGVIKYQWFKNEETIDRSYEGLTFDEYQAKINEPDVELLDVEEIPITEAQLDIAGNEIAPAELSYNIDVRYTIIDEYPLIEAIPSEDFGFFHTTREITKKTFAYHKYKMTKDEFIAEFGEAKWDGVRWTYTAMTDDIVTKERFSDLGGHKFIYDENKEELYLHECYYFDYEKEEPRIITLCGDEIIKDIKNKYRKPPFRVITPLKKAHRICGLSFYDILKDLQKARTAFLRQIFDNLYFANNRRYFGDPTRFSVDDFLNNNFPQALIRTKGDPRSAVTPEEKAPLPPEVSTLWETLNVEKDYHSGVPRAFQGVNPNVLNKTWRGQAQQVGQASQRVSLMARLIAEMGVAPLVSDIINLNLQFLQKKTCIRYLNKWIEISPDNITGKCDVIVNVGLGTGNKDQIILYVQQLIGLYAQMFKAGAGCVTQDNIYNAMKELVKAMNFRNVADFVTDPKFVETVKQLVMVVSNSPLVQQDPQIIPLVQAVASGIGLDPKMQETISGKTFQGQETPAQPESPANPMQPSIRAQGGGFLG